VKPYAYTINRIQRAQQRQALTGALCGDGRGVHGSHGQSDWEGTSKSGNFQDKLVVVSHIDILSLIGHESGPVFCRAWSQYTRKKVKRAHTRLPIVGFRSWSPFLAVSLQVTWVINPAAGCRQACSYPRNPEEGCYQFCCLVNRGMMGVNSLFKTVTRQRRVCDLNPSPTA